MKFETSMLEHEAQVGYTNVHVRGFMTEHFANSTFFLFGFILQFGLNWSYSWFETVVQLGLLLAIVCYRGVLAVCCPLPGNACQFKYYSRSS